VVVELIGGTGAAKELTLEALRAGKPVVTANKKLLAECGEEIFGAARESETDLFYEAAVGGGIPIIRSLREGLIANHIEGLSGILNGTCNYILTRMEREGLPFDRVLREAQENGYAEADPALDVDGWDTAHKAVILASLAYGFPVSLDDVPVAGIRRVTQDDIAIAADLGYRIKLLARIEHRDGQVGASVGPMLVPVDHMLASVHGVFNAVMVTGDIVGETLYYGKGAGRLPTASAVLGDIAEAARNLTADSMHRVPAFVPHDHYGRLRPAEERELRCYMRLTMNDHPGALARVADCLGRRDISIASVLQKQSDPGGFVPVVIVTQRAKEKQFIEALKEIDASGDVGAETFRMALLS
jgi:homoserine dehydrogenase